MLRATEAHIGLVIQLQSKKIRALLQSESNDFFI
jgi:hypothetical protein